MELSPPSSGADVGVVVRLGKGCLPPAFLRQIHDGGSVIRLEKFPIFYFNLMRVRLGLPTN